MNANGKRLIDAKLNSLSKSTFRTSFKLKQKERDYIDKNGLENMLIHLLKVN